MAHFLSVNYQPLRLRNNYFVGPDLENVVALFVESVQINFSFLFWVWNKWKWVKKQVKMYDFRAVARKSHFHEFFHSFSCVSDPKSIRKAEFYTTANKKATKFSKSGPIT